MSDTFSSAQTEDFQNKDRILWSNTNSEFNFEQLIFKIGSNPVAFEQLAPSDAWFKRIMLVINPTFLPYKWLPPCGEH